MGVVVTRRLNADHSDDKGPHRPCECGGEARCDSCHNGFSPRDRALGMEDTFLSPAALRLIGIAAARAGFGGSSTLLRELAGRAEDGGASCQGDLRDRQRDRRSRDQKAVRGTRRGPSRRSDRRPAQPGRDLRGVSEERRVLLQQPRAPELPEVQGNGLLCRQRRGRRELPEHRRRSPQAGGQALAPSTAPTPSSHRDATRRATASTISGNDALAANRIILLYEYDIDTIRDTECLEDNKYSDYRALLVWALPTKQVNTDLEALNKTAQPMPVWHELAFSNACQLKQTIADLDVKDIMWQQIHNPKLLSIAQLPTFSTTDAVPTPKIIVPVRVFADEAQKYFAECMPSTDNPPVHRSLCGAQY